jgi:hypothetical protein
MTESNRKPIGVPPRRNAENLAVQNLMKANRDSATTGSDAPAGSPTLRPNPLPDTAPKQITFYMAADDLRRAKAAYTGTSGKEMDRSWSDFISRAVLMEVERRERLYNEGSQFQGGAQNLAPGRKIQL